MAGSERENHGIPQNRERVYCVIIRKDLDSGNFKFPAPIPLKKALVDMLEDKVDERYYLSDDKIAAMIAPPLRQISNTVRTSGRGSTDRHCWDLLPCWCKAKQKGTQFEGYCDTALTLLARDYKGFGNQQMTGVIERHEDCM